MASKILSPMLWSANSIFWLFVGSFKSGGCDSLGSNTNDWFFFSCFLGLSTNFLDFGSVGVCCSQSV